MSAQVNTQMSNQQTLIAKVWEVTAKLEAMYNIEFKSKLTIAIDIRGCGRLAGQAVYTRTTYKVRFHPGLLQAHGDEFINQVVPHEVCHVACRELYKRNMGHGIEWKNMMRRLGLSPDRCHSWDRLGGPRVSKSSTYKCSICAKDVSVGPKIHKKIQGGYDGYYPKCCGRRAKLIFANGPVVAPVVKQQTPTAYTIPPTNGAGTSKMDKCKLLYAQHKQFGYTRQKWISLFVNMAGCTPAGASTYYQTISKTC